MVQQQQFHRNQKSATSQKALSKNSVIITILLLLLSQIQMNLNALLLLDQTIVATAVQALPAQLKS
jgi:hypothetical protein